MRSTLAVLLSMALACPAVAEPVPGPVGASAPAEADEPLVIKAPRDREQEVVPLKRTRTAGGAVALTGAGMMTYAVVFAAAGPIGWAAGLLFAGGMTAYLAHRRLNGKNDFGPAAPRAAAPAKPASPRP